MKSAADVLVIGAGVNGLATATLLARAGRKVTVLERSEGPGGQGRLLEFAPGFRAPVFGCDAGWTPPAAWSALGLAPPPRAMPEVPLSVPAGAGEWLSLAADPATAAAAIGRWSTKDAAAWPAFAGRIARLAGFLEALYAMPAPDIDTTAPGELLQLLGVGVKLRALGRTDMVELLRTVPMSVQELLDDTFEGGPLRAALASVGVRQIRQGPRSGGTAFVFLHHLVGAPSPGGRGWWRESPDALHQALVQAAAAAGVTIRSGAEVARIAVADEAVTGVGLATGEELGARCVVSTAGPTRTLLDLVDPVWLDPEFRLAVSNVKLRGAATAVLYALEGLPGFAGLADPARALAGTLTLSASLEQIERAADAAKYGAAPERPHVELELPSLRWPALAPLGKHLAVARVQWTPRSPRAGAWDAAGRAALGDRVDGAIEAVAPGFRALVRERLVLTPDELEARFGLADGAATHGEMTLDQILFMRPVAGASRYATPIAGLYLSGAGTHPGGGIPAGSGWLAARAVLRGRP